MMKIFIVNKKSKLDSIRKKHPDASILDITSTSEYRILRVLSPFYPHGNIPIPGMPNMKATCVEAVWQGLKVFEHYGVDYATFRNATMKDIKRTVRKYGKPIGHQYGDRLLNYADARWLIYIPTYLYILKNVPSVQQCLNGIRERMSTNDVVFLDYNTNCDVADYSKPLSHAGLVKMYLEGRYPTIERRFELENGCSINFGSPQEIVQAITSHPRYKAKLHNAYIESVLSSSITNLEDIANLSPRKRDSWRTIIKDIRNNNGVQLSLF